MGMQHHTVLGETFIFLFGTRADINFLTYKKYIFQYFQNPGAPARRFPELGNTLYKQPSLGEDELR